MAETLHILPLRRRSHDTSSPNNPTSSPRNPDGRNPPPDQYNLVVAEILRVCHSTADAWLSYLCSTLSHHYHSPLDRPLLRSPSEAGGESPGRELGSMLVTAFILEHAGTIGSAAAAEGRKNPSPETVTPRVPRKRNPSVNEAEEDEEDREPDDEGDRPRTSKRVRSDDASASHQASFACPFFKMNPIRHQACLFYKMSKISYVKQHLQRTHRGPKWRCPACHEVCPDQAAYNRHLTSHECQGPRSKARQDEMSESQWEEIGGLTSRRAGATTESMWYAMYEVLFPGTPRPETPYVESGISEMTRHFRDFAKERGPAIIRGHLESTGSWQSLVDSGVNPDMLLQFVMSSGIDMVFESWGSSTDSAGTPTIPAERISVPRSVFRGENITEGSSFQFPPRSQPASTSYLPPVSTFFDPRISPPRAMEPLASPTMYHARGYSSVSAPETPVPSELSSDTGPLTAIRRGRGPRSNDSSSVDAPETVPATPTRGPRDLSISALTEETAPAVADPSRSPRSDR